MRFFAAAALLLSSVALAAPAQEQTKDCCCCDISQPAFVCEKNVKPEDCICAAVMCPVNAPTYWPATATATATATPTTTPTATVVKRQEDKKPATTAPTQPPCCCCSLADQAIVCEVRPEGADNTCVCPKVMCPVGAPTLTTTVGAQQTGN
ncbi:hypothetical protein FVEN_g4715 [Fusarium venenatum]|uniref:Extracellular membrane protein CFEM domain-containing protein n=1 Tax=Fusarium venenatum TaxID=56646 RepID=A0A2L2T106_9HYPO|nr:uncharacterized protein FVRRES_11430 [Fusarium venenatum]KAG8357435.1 hypothetical protein FVEN_g4715 [Fusarium venenatum]KAH6978129.1 hypothetical protein EDB82DRAFT_503596 [Fusarium venenatum]CEI38739.1 unnamed protein product [Fusarium venenatum]